MQIINLFSPTQDKHCLLELGLPSVEALLRHGIYPIVIHIRPKTKKHKKLRYVSLLNATNHHGCANITSSPNPSVHRLCRTQKVVLNVNDSFHL